MAIPLKYNLRNLRVRWRVTLATALYTSIGGIRAVIWTDVIQIIVLICALGFSLNYLLGHIPGGWAGATKLLTGDKDLLVLKHYETIKILAPAQFILLMKHL